MQLKGALAKLMCNVNQGLYRRSIINNKKGTLVLYLKIHKASYGLLQSALIFYGRLVSELEDYGFKLNLYDPCAANIDIHGS